VKAEPFGRRTTTLPASLDDFAMPIPIPLAIALYFTIWWVVLFAVLPFGITSQHETGHMVPGTEPSAPIAPRLWLKALVTTLISAVVFAIVLWALYYFG
jgi:predicted secreted protein